MEYERNGVAHLVLFYAPFENWRRIQVADDHTACKWAEGECRLVQEDYVDEERITLVMDNLNTHTGASLYKAFPPEMARALLDKLEFVIYPQAWQLAEHGRMRIQCVGAAMPGEGIARYINSSNRNCRLGRESQPEDGANRLALYNRRCAYQAEVTLA